MNVKVIRTVIWATNTNTGSDTHSNMGNIYKLVLPAHKIQENHFLPIKTALDMIIIHSIC